MNLHSGRRAGQPFVEYRTRPVNVANWQSVPVKSASIRVASAVPTLPNVPRQPRGELNSPCVLNLCRWTVPRRQHGRTRRLHRQPRMRDRIVARRDCMFVCGTTSNVHVMSPVDGGGEFGSPGLILDGHPHTREWMWPALLSAPRRAMAQSGNTSPLGVVKSQSPSHDPRLQHPVLFAQERDDVRLLSLKPINRIGQELKRKAVCSLSPQRSIQLWGNTGRRMGHFEGRNTVSRTRSRVPSQSGRRLSSTGSRRATTEDSAHLRHQARPERSVRIVPAIAPPGPDSGRATRASRGSARTAAGVGGPLRRRRGACPCRAFRGNP